jgi:hypothetical protein
VALQGTLESFGISEIFQLVSQQGKTGTLEIDSGEGVARIRFLEGRLLEAWPDKRSPTELIGTLLVRAGLITPPQLDHALTVQRESLRPLGDILIRLGALRLAEFQEVLTLQHRDTVYRLLRLRRGSFFFRTEPVEVDEGVSAPMDVGSLLMEGFRQLDEWPKLLERVPGEGRVCLRTEASMPSGLSREESRVLGLVDGAATVRQIVDRSRLGEFVAREALSRLLADELVVPAEVVRQAAPVTGSTRRWAAGPALDALLSLVLLVATLLSLAVTGSGGQVLRLTTAVSAARAEAHALQERARAWSRAEPQVWPSAARRRAPAQPEAPAEGEPARLEERGGEPQP